MAKAQNNAWSLVIIQQMIPKQRNFEQKLKLEINHGPWIPLGLQKSVAINSHLLTKYLKLKDVTLKTKAQTK